MAAIEAVVKDMRAITLRFFRHFFFVIDAAFILQTTAASKR